jgi:type II secretory pathway pseudopilin PulG
MAFHFQKRRGRRGEDGYILLTLLLAVALMMIFTAAIVPTIKFEIERDREEEMIHRGVQYARAIQHYYKKFGRYPTKIEDLESANNLRFLRKRYKDPTNCRAGKCQDFKLLHFGEVKLTFSGGIGGGTIPGASPAGSPGGLNSTGGFGQTSTFGGNTSFGTNSNSLGQNQPTGQNAQGDNQTAGPDQSDTSSSLGTSSGTSAGTSNAGGSGDSSGTSHDQLAGVTFGGGPIVGVVSANKRTGYREFNHKKKYSEWQFIYDPGTDRGGLLMGPNQPAIQGFGQQGTQNVNGQNSSSGIGSGTFGSSGMQNNPTSPSSGGFGTSNQNQPSNPPQQQ